MPSKKSASVKKQNKMPTWNLGQLYSSPKDPQIEKDVVEMENLIATFAKKYDTQDKKYLHDAKVLLEALTEYETLTGQASGKPLLYFSYFKDIDGSNTYATAQLTLLSNRLTVAANALTFFEVSLGAISLADQNKFLADKNLAHFKVYLERIFSDAKHNLSIPEEKIMNLKSLPSYELWVQGNQRILNSTTVLWKGNKLPISKADQLMHTIKNPKERYALAKLVNEALKGVSTFSEAEINAVITNKKINDSLRGYTTAYANTVQTYRNDPAVVDVLVSTVTDAFPVAHRFYRLKARLLKLKKLHYVDRNIEVGSVKATYTFDKSVDILKSIFGEIDPKYAAILDEYIARGSIDAPSRVGKRSGAYCSSAFGLPTFVLLNHNDGFDSLKTFAHEMGHAFHSELSEKQGPIYCNYSYALAETASTLFESIVLEKTIADLPEKERMIALHDKIQDDMSTIFRQIACFNFENDLHTTIRAQGQVSKEDICRLHNKHMKAYLGPQFDLTEDDGYFFVQWGHIRQFFYVYSYAYGMLVTKALLRRYRNDKTFWASIEQFLSAGGSAAPEEILASIGIDLSSPDFFKEGIKEIEEDITKLEKLIRK